MKKKLTIKDIAKELNVSISTVSKALNDSHEIADVTKKRIQAYAKEFKYKPNFNALSLKNKKTKTIAVLIPNMLKYIYAQVFNGIEQVANELGYKIITCVSNEKTSKEIEILEMLSNGSIDGFIISPALETSINKDYVHFQNIIEEGFPIVMYDRAPKELDCDKVVIKDHKATYNAVEHLKNTGCKNIAFISTHTKLASTKKRKKGYIKALEEFGLDINREIMIDMTGIHYKEYEKILTPILEKHKIDGVITTNEATGIAIQKVAQKLGYKIPENFSVIAFSNGILARHASPQMTTISQHGEKMGAKAAKLLIQRIENENETLEYETKIIQTDLVMRNSTKKFLKLNYNV
ncbi:LacI family DNA-binding transcriptional regulator [Wenyingzhuangia sp. 2_MG-2023]|uniref:LacI family DNA-binding transcriptional regulator n=1 Tax=Wenyingzhuangia sp. 2_MG-2023 TaxID=3062639 RepID=UPI0026E45E54|nr:LacI family DNA-binding transcriptional regulator [Wenyingzhuangia sp. 2_MG-2023]MDO6737684.1 LacI family DNA-binding transcriptional regulator [Wenyingzhuangia sp. 2_MG-2023]MDO6802523.1 LacI family DNA-binding transcriptional regulator [Wenyingzhuangia sp. 1_MG-2023]